jgi:hypothetical protein
MAYFDALRRARGALKTISEGAHDIRCSPSGTAGNVKYNCTALCPVRIALAGLEASKA